MFLSVRGEARRSVVPDRATVNCAINVVGPDTDAAREAVGRRLETIRERLAQLGGSPLTAESDNSALTWSAPSIHTHPEYVREEATQRHCATADLAVRVREVALIGRVVGQLTAVAGVTVHGVRWSVDEENLEWAAVRADAIAAAIAKAKHYAAALGGELTAIEHLADSGLLGDTVSAARMSASAESLGFSAQSDSESDGGLRLDIPPKTIHAVVEARFRATTTALGDRDA